MKKRQKRVIEEEITGVGTTTQAIPLTAQPVDQSHPGAPYLFKVRRVVKNLKRRRDGRRTPKKGNIRAKS